jgi:hypothetical protein
MWLLLIKLIIPVVLVAAMHHSRLDEQPTRLQLSRLSKVSDKSSRSLISTRSTLLLESPAT